MNQEMKVKPNIKLCQVKVWCVTDSIWKNLSEQSELCVTVHNNLDEALPDPGDMPIHNNKHKLRNSETHCKGQR